MAMIPDSTSLEEDDSELSCEWVTQNRKLENKLEREESRKDEWHEILIYLSVQGNTGCIYFSCIFI